MKLILEPVEAHTHKPCKHTCRCISAKGGCPKCASIRDHAAEVQRNERNRQQQVAGR